MSNEGLAVVYFLRILRTASRGRPVPSTLHYFIFQKEEMATNKD